MLKKLILLTLVICSTNVMFSQTLEELKAKKAMLKDSLGVIQGEAGALQGEIDAINKEIIILSGWKKGFSGLIGLDLGGTNQWISSPNPTSRSSALGIGITAFANNDGRKHFWNNKLIINKAWQDIDIIEGEDDDLFDQGTTDILNLSSLAGYKLTPKIALSGLAELNTSIKNFTEPGTFDIGIGATWTPIQNLVVVLHPLNYHIAWSADGDASTEGAVGCKIRADYQDDFNVAGKKISWSSTFTSFLPYTGKKVDVQDINKYGVPQPDPNNPPDGILMREAGLFEYTWLNTLSFQVWKGIGLGFTFGLRDADFEFQDLQTFYNIGVSYTL